MSKRKLSKKGKSSYFHALQDIIQEVKETLRSSKNTLSHMIEKFCLAHQLSKTLRSRVISSCFFCMCRLCNFSSNENLRKLIQIGSRFGFSIFR